DPLGDPLVGEKLAEIVSAQERRQLVDRDIGVDGHGATGRGEGAPGEDPERWIPVFGRDHARRMETERDDPSKKGRHAPGESYSAAAMSRRGRGSGKNTSSSAAVTASIFSV